VAAVASSLESHCDRKTTTRTTTTTTMMRTMMKKKKLVHYDRRRLCSSSNTRCEDLVNNWQREPESIYDRTLFFLECWLLPTLAPALLLFFTY
jgi:hypothetical protein